MLISVNRVKISKKSDRKFKGSNIKSEYTENKKLHVSEL